jgi:outer membrane protein assembly factor BamB
MSRYSLRTASGFSAARLALAVLPGLALVGLIVTASVGAIAQDATQPASTGSTLTAPMAVDWKYTAIAFSNNPAQPVVAGDTVYFASGERAYAVSLLTGANKWTYPSEGSLVSPVQGTPILNGTTLFLPTGDGLYALDATDGKLKYPAYKVSKGGVVTTPTVIGSGVYFGTSDGRLYALNTATGDPLSAAWQKGLNVGTEFSGDVVNQNGILYFFTSNQVLHAIDAATGVEKWNRRVEGNVEGVTPTVSGENIYAATGQSLTCWRTATGLKQWTLTTRSDITAPPAIDADGNFYLVSALLGVYALDSRRQPIWKQVPKVDYEVTTRPIIADNLLILGTTAGGLYGFDKKTGDLKWNYALRPTSLDATRVPTVAKVSNPPVVDGNRLLVLSDDGTLTAFRSDAADTLPPTVDDLAPEAGEYCNGRPPFTVRAHIVDDGSGLDTTSITLKLDDQTIPRRASVQEASEKPGFTYDKDNGILEYTILENDTGRSKTLSDGHHTATITARDWKGNVQTKSWTFTIDDTLPQQKYLRVANRTQGGGPGRGGRPGAGGGAGLGAGAGGGKGGGGGGGGD